MRLIRRRVRMCESGMVDGRRGERAGWAQEEGPTSVRQVHFGGRGGERIEARFSLWRGGEPATGKMVQFGLSTANVRFSLQGRALLEEPLISVHYFPQPVRCFSSLFFSSSSLCSLLILQISTGKAPELPCLRSPHRRGRGIKGALRAPIQRVRYRRDSEFPERGRDEAVGWVIRNFAPSLGLGWSLRCSRGADEPVGRC